VARVASRHRTGIFASNRGDRRRPLFALASFSAILCGATAVAGQADFVLSVKDMGIRRHIEPPEISFWLEVANPSDGPLAGFVTCRQKRPSFFEEDLDGARTIAMRVRVPPKASSTLCFPVGFPFVRPDAPVEFRLTDDRGEELARLRTDPADDKLFSKSGDRLVGVLAADPTTVQTIQEGILFTKERSGKEFFRQSSAKFIYLSSDMPDCWQSVRVLDDLVVALPSAELSAAQRESIRQAMFSGLRVVVVDSLEGNPAFLEAYSRVGGGSGRVGKGSLRRAASIADEKTWSGLLQPEAEWRGYRRMRLERDDAPMALFHMEGWAAPRYQRPTAPGATALLTFLGAYVLVLGPVSFVLLRARNHREKAWLITPLITVAFSLALVIWIQVRQFHHRQLDTTVVLTSDQRWSEMQASVFARLSSPQARSYDITVSGFLRVIESFHLSSRKPIDLVRGEDTLEIKGIAVPRWSSMDLAIEGHGAGASPVLWTEAGIRNQLAVPFEEALLLTTEGWFDIGRLAPGAAWQPNPGSRRPLTQLVQLFGAAKPEERTRLLHALGLWDLNALEEVKAKLRTVRGVFLGTTRESLLRFAVEPGPEVTQSWTVYQHHFSAGDGRAEASP
jgi:hypothetical protein